MVASNTYGVIYLGTVADLDPTEGNPVAENANTILNTTFGSSVDPLWSHVGTMSPVGSPGDYYRTNNNSFTDQFTIDGGSAQTFDSISQYTATLTYTDGTAATLSTAVVFQDSTGKLYLAPKLTNDVDQQALAAKSIRSITLTTLNNNSNFGMDVVRVQTDFVCFARGTLIETSIGPRPIEELRPGDALRTADRGFQPLRWVGSATVAAIGRLAPVRIAAHAIGNTRALVVSQQHRILSWGELKDGTGRMAECFIPAKKLVNGSTIRLQEGGEVEYFHLLLDRHEVLYSEGVPTESFYPGREGWKMLTERSRLEILDIFPDLHFKEDGTSSYGPLARPAGKPAKQGKLARAC